MRVRSKAPAATSARRPGPRPGAVRTAFSRRIRRARGFTLIELAIVIFIMGLMVTIALPYFGGLKGEQLRGAARRLSGRATFLFDQASAQKVVIRLVFDLDRNAYHVMVLDPFAPNPLFVPGHSPGDRPVLLPPNVRIRDVTVEGAGTYRRGAVGCQFYPEGYADAALIHLANTSGAVITLGVDPLTGEVRIANGDLSQQQLFLR